MRNGGGSDRIALVVSGGGARGAYEAGVLSVLLPALEQRRERPTVIVGTSVGALNATFLASTADRPAAEAAAGAVARWRRVSKGEVIRPVLLRQAPLVAARALGTALAVPGARLSGLLDATPMARNIQRWIDWGALRRNVDRGRCDALAVVATQAATGRTTAFVGARAGRGLPRSEVVDYVRTDIRAEHLGASAAIPLVFPPVHVRSPARAAGWYVDGGIRFSTPIKPALDLGAERLVVVGTASPPHVRHAGKRETGHVPGFADAAIHLLNGALVDPIAEDLRNLGNINVSIVEQGGHTHTGRVRRDQGKTPYRVVPYLFLAPERPWCIGEIANEVFRARYGGLRRLRSLDFGALGAFLDDCPQHGELLSYLFFDSAFVEELIALGREDCERWLGSAAGERLPWSIGPPGAPSDAIAPRPARPHEHAPA
jgi:NTE family protein